MEKINYNNIEEINLRIASCQGNKPEILVKETTLRRLSKIESRDTCQGNKPELSSISTKQQTWDSCQRIIPEVSLKETNPGSSQRKQPWNTQGDKPEILIEETRLYCQNLFLREALAALTTHSCLFNPLLISEGINKLIQFKKCILYLINIT